MSEEVAISAWVEADVCSPDGIMFPNESTIANAGHQPERFVERDIECFFPYFYHAIKRNRGQDTEITHSEVHPVHRSFESWQVGSHAHQRA
jgi:hypothetical protein